MNIRILIVEDEFVVANALRLAVEQAGYIVTDIAATVDEAERSIRKTKPELVILDIRLEGELSGIDLAHRLTKQHIAFIYLSANSSQRILEAARETEPYGFLIKPFREKDLLVALDIALYRHQHSLESTLRQAEFLEKQLAAVVGHRGAKDRLLQIAQLLQPYIPFDLIVAGPAPDPTQINDIAYLRIAFDEYQFIGEKELLTITGIKKNRLCKLMADTEIVDGITTNADAVPSSLQTIWFKKFALHSCITFSVTAPDAQTMHYFFYSRQKDSYGKRHADLLNRLKDSLAFVSGNFLVDNISALSGTRPHRELIKESAPVFDNIIGNHPLLLAALDLTMQVAPYNTSVLLLGESGTGKERIAQAVHDLSPRKEWPFVKINCAAIPENLIESELFGHEKGSFTGAIEKRKGKFEQAEGGTVFLDEIGELPISMQVKLLRVLQEKEIEYVGGSTAVKINVRIIAATSRNLEKEVAEGRFRLDLYYRLNVFPILLPALRERKTDIEALTMFFVGKFCTEFNRPLPAIAGSMMEEMMAYHWPGNIRELENIMEQAIILYDGKGTLQLKRSLIAAEESNHKKNIETYEDVKQLQTDTEKEYLISILKKTGGRIRGVDGAAALLQIKPTTLASKIAKLNIDRTGF